MFYIQVYTHLNINCCCNLGICWWQRATHTIQAGQAHIHACPPSRGSNTDARGQVTVCLDSPSTHTHTQLFHTGSCFFILSLSIYFHATYVFFKCVHVASGDGAKAWLGWTKLSCPRVTLQPHSSKISRGFTAGATACMRTPDFYMLLERAHAVS